jgi:hypothetical protein
MDATFWKQEYQRLCAAYGRTPSIEQAGVYLDALARYENEEMRAAVGAAMTRCKFFPTVADLVACCGPAQSDEADPLFPQFRKWQIVNANDPEMLSITFRMFRNYIEGNRGW